MIYSIKPSLEQIRPEIDFDESAESGGVEWGHVGEILDGERPLDDYEVIHLVVPHPNVASWHYYIAPGTLGLISMKTIDVIGRSAFRLLNLLPAKLNDSDFFLLTTNEHLPCFDAANAEFQTIPVEPNRIMRITKYAFKTENVHDPLLFTIPEYPFQLLATRSVCDAIARHKLRGFRVKQLTP